MKKSIFAVALLATILFSSCNSCNGCKQPVGVAIETDSIYRVNDSTLYDVQTFVFEGTTPMQNNAIADVILTVRSINLNSDGTYSITTDYIDEGYATRTDNGEAIFIMGTDNDSTATVIELVSNNNNPSMSFVMLDDSSLVKVDNNGKPASMHKDHRLKIKTTSKSR